MKSRRRAWQGALVASVAACLGWFGPAAQASEMTIGGADPCDTSVTVWWKVPPDPGQWPAGFSVYYSCLLIDRVDLREYLPVVGVPSTPITIDLPIEP